MILYLLSFIASALLQFFLFSFFFNIVLEDLLEEIIFIFFISTLIGIAFANLYRSNNSSIWFPTMPPALIHISLLFTGAIQNGSIDNVIPILISFFSYVLINVAYLYSSHLCD